MDFVYEMPFDRPHCVYGVEFLFFCYFVLKMSWSNAFSSVTSMEIFLNIFNAFSSLLYVRGLICDILTVADNTLLVLNPNEHSEIHKLKNGYFITLDEFQLQNLKEDINDFNESILVLLYKKYLPSLISNKLTPTETFAEEFTILKAMLASIIKH